MSDNDFWVNPPKMAESADGYEDKAKQLNDLHRRLEQLTDPGLLNTAIGNDSAGKQFMQAHLQIADNLQQGLQAWTDAVDSTGGAVRAVANNFGGAESNAADNAAQLSRSLNGDGGSAGGGVPEGPSAVSLPNGRSVVSVPEGQVAVSGVSAVPDGSAAFPGVPGVSVPEGPSMVSVPDGSAAFSGTERRSS